jgi:FMN phosphatase YigB (HAD superfamily)
MKVSDPYFSTDRCVDRILEWWDVHKSLIVAFDFDDTIYDYHKKGYSHDKVLELLRACQAVRCTLIMFTTDESPENIKWKVKYCADYGITVKWINESPVMPLAKKPFYNILLDDKAGLGQSYEILEQAMQYIKEHYRQ